MGCTSCSTGGCGSSDKKKGGCASGGCNKMNVFDWLSNMDLPVDQQFDVIEVRFKNGRKEFFRNTHQLDLFPGDPVAVNMGTGYHVGHVSLQGELVRLQMLKKKIKEEDVVLEIYRLATETDLDRHKETKAREMPTMFRTRQIIQDFKLSMKLSDVEFQADNSKATFYYSADARVDFRELIKVLAAEFKIRVEMRQISLRQEAGRLGGLGVCGRELCCSTWLSDFKNVPTSAARYQNLSLNPSKLSGQCGRLKCCLNYELETYVEALKDIPTIEKPLKTAQGNAFLKKTDIFKKLMWFGYESENSWHPLTIEQVKEILAMNEKGEMPENLGNVVEEVKKDFEEVMELEAEAFHKKIDANRNRKRKRRNKRGQVKKDKKNPQVTNKKAQNQRKKNVKKRS